MYLLRRTCADCSLAFEVRMHVGHPWPTVCRACEVKAAPVTCFPNGTVDKRGLSKILDR